MNNKRTLKLKQTILIALLLISVLVKSQEKRPVLKPFKLDGIGEIKAPNPMPDNGWVMVSSKIKLTDIKTEFPYRITAHFDDKKLISLHVIFGDNDNSLPFETYKKIKNELIKHWDYLPTLFVKDRRKIGNKTQVWETKNYRIEWTYQNQPNSKTKKMGWLFLYNRDQFIENYY